MEWHMKEIKQLKLDIAASLYIAPCNIDELCQRDFLKSKSKYGIERIIMLLEKDALYYKGDIMHIKKKWAKKHLQHYELDFRTKKEKYMDSLTPFAKSLMKKGLI